MRLLPEFANNDRIHWEINSEFRERLTGALNKLHDEGVFVTITSLLRLYSEQEALYDGWLRYKAWLDGGKVGESPAVYNLAAPPGTSRHETGYAGDLDWDHRNTARVVEVLEEYGLWQAVRTQSGSVLEDWHWELAPNRGPMPVPPPPPVHPQEEEDIMFTLRSDDGTVYLFTNQGVVNLGGLPGVYGALLPKAPDAGIVPSAEAEEFVSRWRKMVANG